MRPLSDSVPKALLRVGAKSLIEWQIERLVAAGIRELVINHAWLGAAIEAQLGDGRRYGAAIAYSREGEALEVAGGIAHALPLLGDSPFALVSADVYTTFDYSRFLPVGEAIARGFPEHVGHLVLTDNPPYHPEGDMPLARGSIARPGADDTTRLTYASIGVLHPQLFEALDRNQKHKLFPWLYECLAHSRISGEYFQGVWENVGSPAQLAQLDARLTAAGKSGAA
jgi:MurNAc alpha-1-phosphate uridylyltransferase